jgi:two-component system response regulator (stage 0 sporulation protein A)
MKNYETEIQQILEKLGVGLKYVGSQYAIYGTNLVIDRSRYISDAHRWIYIDIADKFISSQSNVERSIRTIISIIWERGDREFLNQIFCTELTRKPKNMQFIKALSKYVINTYGYEEGDIINTTQHEA